jgi:hypothetical protein
MELRARVMQALYGVSPSHELALYAGPTLATTNPGHADDDKMGYVLHAIANGHTAPAVMVKFISDHDGTKLTEEKFKGYLEYLVSHNVIDAKFAFTKQPLALMKDISEREDIDLTGVETLAIPTSDPAGANNKLIDWVKEVRCAQYASATEYAPGDTIRVWRHNGSRNTRMARASLIPCGS